MTVTQITVPGSNRHGRGRRAGGSATGSLAGAVQVEALTLNDSDSVRLDPPSQAASGPRAAAGRAESRASGWQPERRRKPRCPSRRPRAAFKLQA
jgi:hypothetical protein